MRTTTLKTGVKVTFNDRDEIVSVSSPYLQAVKNSRYKHPIEDVFFKTMNSLKNLYS